MSINPNPIASTTAASQIAGVSRAVRKGGEVDKQASDLTAKQASATNPGGKQTDVSAVEGGEKAGDRGGDGRQMLDDFQNVQDQEQSQPNDEKTDNEKTADEASAVEEPTAENLPDRHGDGHVDFQA